LKVEKPLVSIAIVTYNQREYLRECIESCLNQDYPNFEIAVADDCSTDGSQVMLKEYAVKYPEKFVLNLAEKNQGITPNSNACLALCSGEFIAVLGGDDLLLPKKISRQVEAMLQNPAIALCGTYTRLIDSTGKKIGLKKDFKIKREAIYDLCELIESGNSLVPVVSYMFRSEFIPEERYEPRIPVASDALFMCRVVKEKKILIIKEELTAYRVHESHAKKIGYSLDSILTWAFLEFYFPECMGSLIKRKSNYYFIKSVTLFVANKNEEGIKYLNMSLSVRKNLKSYALYIIVKLKLFLFFYGFLRK
jgi:glycosyltransferase involved in cell wall biosynthesis